MITTEFHSLFGFTGLGNLDIPLKSQTKLQVSIQV